MSGRSRRRREPSGCSLHREVQSVPCYKCQRAAALADMSAQDPQDYGMAYPTDPGPEFNN